MRKIISLIMVLIIIVQLAACSNSEYDVSSNVTIYREAKINGINLAEFTLVHSENASVYVLRAAEYISNEIKNRTNVNIEIVSDISENGPFEHEIVVGETNRDISNTLNVDTKDLEFSLMADGGHVAIEGDGFVIAAAAYYFVENYITDKTNSTNVPQKATVCKPITKKPKNFILLIGDGMGVSQTKLFDEFSSAQLTDYSDGEDVFYGYMFPYSGFAHTNNALGTVTDSAASATALATGYKTINGYVGKNRNQRDLLSITELASSKGMSTAVMSTESSLGATPAAFSAHAASRSDTTTIQKSQAVTQNKYGTIIKCDYNYHKKLFLDDLVLDIQNVLTELSKNDEGFFIMYEEAYIDKHCHNNNKEAAFEALVRFNLAIAQFMEFAFYNPDTFVLITADHETGDMKVANGIYEYNSEDHSTQDVPVFAYGAGAKRFDGKTIENVQIPKTIATLMGEKLAENTDKIYPPLK